MKMKLLHLPNSMFLSLRWRLTAWFVFLAAIVYIAMSGAGLALFKTSLTQALDQELRDFADEILPAVEFDGRKLSLKSALTGANLPVAPRGKHRSSRLLVSVQLFDANGKLIQEFGPHAVNELLPGSKEASEGDYKIRSLSRQVLDGSRLAGYLQVQLPTSLRDHSISQFEMVLLLILPLLLFGLGISGYIFAGKASMPVEEAFNTLRQFVADAGHEFGTPISIIQAAAENLSEEAKSNQIDQSKVTARAQAISRSAERMSKLAQDLMILARFESRHLSEAGQAESRLIVKMDEVVQEAVEEMEDFFHLQRANAAEPAATAEPASGKRVVLSIPEGASYMVLGYSDALYDMVANLLKNALIYSGQDGLVQISLKAQTHALRLTVEDNGIGIPPESLPKIFDRFYRVDRSRAASSGSSGLGLAIVKSAVELHHGAIDVHSKVGEGTVFSIILPLK